MGSGFFEKWGVPLEGFGGDRSSGLPSILRQQPIGNLFFDMGLNLPGLNQAFVDGVQRFRFGLKVRARVDHRGFLSVSTGNIPRSCVYGIALTTWVYYVSCIIAGARRVIPEVLSPSLISLIFPRQPGV